MKYAKTPTNKTQTSKTLFENIKHYFIHMLYFQLQRLRRFFQLNIAVQKTPAKRTQFQKALGMLTLLEEIQNKANVQTPRGNA